MHDVAEAADFLAVRAALRGERAVDDDLRLAEDLRREPAGADAEPFARRRSGMFTVRDGHPTPERIASMRLFIDTGSVAEVEEIAAWGVLSGATTNPSLLAKEEGDPGDAIRRICDLVDGPVSAEVVSDDARGWSPRAARCARCTSTSS